MKKIFQKTHAKNLTFNHVCEVGVYLPETSNVIDYINSDIRCDLVEADPVTIEKIKDHFKNKNNVNVFNFAVWDYDGTVKLSRAAASTFVSALSSSPAMVNDGYQINDSKTFQVDCKKFSAIDDGTIDLLSIDIEGSEWYVLKYIVSKPKVISIETHGNKYVNPNILLISEWMAKNNYTEWYKDSSDTIYVKTGLIDISLIEKISLKFKTFRIRARRLRKKLFLS